MPWWIAGVVYMAGYAFAIWFARDAPLARLWIGNVGLLIPPVVPIALVLRRRGGWRGHHRVFWDAIAAGAALWLGGQIPWTIYELSLQRPMPWLNPIVIL